jgi:hypothetical protein
MKFVFDNMFVIREELGKFYQAQYRLALSMYKNVAPSLVAVLYHHELSWW